ncbi:hypothetical protein PVK06_042699 [Gossypium arboreum]|uniref:RNase H type-1 domain-containing protein n=1 Tax=Gossypium arboreum TaxID=29729 RepID=A0ABR0MLF7_GOSAR|nr:hypothetical protein PVK06_042699 [Gossypium arboreum]
MEVLASKTTVHTDIFSSFAAEANACLQAIKVRRDLGLNHVIIEGDSLTVIKKVQSQKRDRSEIEPFIFNIKDEKAVFYDCQFQHVRRIANVAAHNRASEGLKIDKNTYIAPVYVGKGITEAEIDREWR